MRHGYITAFTLLSVAVTALGGLFMYTLNNMNAQITKTDDKANEALQDVAAMRSDISWIRQTLEQQTKIKTSYAK